MLSYVYTGKKNANSWNTLYQFVDRDLTYHAGITDGVDAQNVQLDVLCNW